VKLPAHRAGLSGNAVSSYIVPLPACRQVPYLPAYRRQAKRDGARSGQEKFSTKCGLYALGAES